MVGKEDAGDLSWTCDDPAETERRVREVTSATHPNTIELLDELGQAYLLAFTGAPFEGIPYYAPSVFFAKSFQTFRSAARLCATGYYSQAGGLCRFLFEEALLIDYYRRFPVEAENFLLGADWEELRRLLQQLRESLLDEADDTSKELLDGLEREIRYHRTPMASQRLWDLRKRLRAKKLRRAKECLHKIETELNKDRIPPFQELISTLGLTRAQQARLRRKYDALCHFVHSRRDPTLLSVVTKGEKHAFGLVVGPKYDMRAFKQVASYVVELGHFALTTWTCAAPALLGDRSWTSQLQKLGNKDH